MEYKIYELKEDNKEFLLKHSFDERIKQADQFLSDPNAICYYVANEQTVLGYVYGYILPRFNNNPMLYIHSIDVDKDYRNIGVGTLMMNTMIAYAKERDFYKVFLITNKGNLKAMRLYKKVQGSVLHDDDIVFEWK